MENESSSFCRCVSQLELETKVHSPHKGSQSRRRPLLEPSVTNLVWVCEIAELHYIKCFKYESAILLGTFHKEK